MEPVKSSPPLSLKPPLSPEIKKSVDELILNLINKHSEEAVKYTCCTTTQCWKACILKARIKDGVITACESDDTVNPGITRDDAYLDEENIKKGMIQIRPCAKAYAKRQMVYDSNRVIYPMKRVGERGEGKFVRISWKEALDTIAKKMIEIREKYGPLSILHQPYSCFSASSFPLASWFEAGVAGWDCHSTNGFQQPTKWVFGKALPQDEVQVFNSNLIVLWGLNPTTHQHGEWNYYLILAKEKGIPIICIEPRYTITAEVLADQWIPIRPTTDVAMMIAMTNVWFKEDIYDKDFVEEWVEPSGFKKWKNYALGIEDGVDKTPEWAEKICGVPGDTIRDFARLYAKSKPVNLNVSLSIGRQFYGENPARASMYLQAMTGNIFIPGGTPAAGTGLPPGYPTGPIPHVDWRRGPPTYTAPVVMAAFKWGKAVALREKLDRGEISNEEYNNLIGGVAGAEPTNIQMLIFENNHLNNLPDMNATMQGMKKVEFVVVFSQYKDTITAKYADILLPQIYTWFEGRNCEGLYNRYDLFRIGMGLKNYFIYCQKCVDPVGEVKPHDWVWTQLAKRLGIIDQYNPRMKDVPDDRWDEAVEELHKEAYEKWMKRKDVAPLKPPSWQEFQEKPVFRYEINDPYYPYKDDLEKGENPFKRTRSGKIEFYSDLLAKGPEHLATHDYLPTGGGTCYGGGKLPPMAKWIPGGWDTFYGPYAEKYPLLMSSPHSRYREHSFMNNNPWLREDCYVHAIWISVADAKTRGIKDNDLVRVYNDIGEMLIPAYVTSRVTPGTVFVFHGSWYRPSARKSSLMPEGIDEGGAVNFLTHNEDLPITIVGFFPCKALVQVEKFESDC